MTDAKKPLPEPPKRPFGRKKFGPVEHQGELLADELTDAAMRGTVDEFLQDQIGDNPNARRLAEMMMGMTGMGNMAGIPAAAPPAGDSSGDPPAGGDGAEQSTGSENPPEPSEEMVAAAQAGDVQSLMGLLKAEHERRTGRPVTDNKKSAPESADPGGPSSADGNAGDRGFLDKESLDTLLAIAGAQGVGVDWLIARAITLYLRDYRLTGRL